MERLVATRTFDTIAHDDERVWPSLFARPSQSYIVSLLFTWHDGAPIHHAASFMIMHRFDTPWSRRWMAIFTWQYYRVMCTQHEHQPTFDHAIYMYQCRLEYPCNGQTSTPMINGFVYALILIHAISIFRHIPDEKPRWCYHACAI